MLYNYVFRYRCKEGASETSSLLVGASLSEPHIDRNVVREVYVCMYVCLLG